MEARGMGRLDDDGRGRFRGNAGRFRGRRRSTGQSVCTDVHHDLVDLGIIGAGHLGGQERLRDRD
jgi:hypothetical protein